MKLIIQIALGIILAGIIIFAANTAYKNYANYTLDKSIQGITERNKKVAEAQKLALLQKEQRHKARIEKEQRLRVNKHFSWIKYYKEPEDCQVFQSDKHMVECVNHKMRAKREFEKLYSSRSLPGQQKDPSG
jgi:hypothetical protein